MFEAGRDLWRSFGKTLLLKQDHLLRTMSSWLWNISRGGDSTTSLGYFMVKKVFPGVWRDRPLFQFALIVFCLGITEKSIIPFSLHSPFIYVEKILL